MAVTIEDIKKLRTMTGAGMKDCKKALNEADGDIKRLWSSFVSVVWLSLQSVLTAPHPMVAYSLSTRMASLP